jgi:hypothetical protein
MNEYTTTRLEAIKIAKDYMTHKYNEGQLTGFPTMEEILKEAEKVEKFLI